MTNIYVENGYADRTEYLESLAFQLGIPEEIVFAAADILGPNEDFDGLVTNLEDESERLDKYR